jgi:prepilin-type N-terminal cleavage/methylation domain-containing protein
MYCPASNRLNQRGFSTLELVIVVVIISLLIVFAVDRLLVLRVDAERVAVEQLAGTIRSAMGIQVAATVATEGGLQNIGNLNKSNPMALLAETPGTYLGELDKADPAAIEAGYWYFDKQQGMLVYRVINSGYLQTELEGPARIRFQLQLVYTDKNRNRRYDAGRDSIHGLRLKAVEAYKWKKHVITDNSDTEKTS